MMWYKQPRLDHALQVYRESEPYRRRHGFQTGNLERYLQRKKYELRGTKMPELPKHVGLWDDKDESGDYNPSKERKRRRFASPPNVRKPKPRASETEDHEYRYKRVRHPRGMTWQKGRQLGRVKKITLELKSEAGRRLLRRLFGESVAGKNDCNIDNDENEGSDTKEESPSLWTIGREGFNTATRNRLARSIHRLSRLNRDDWEDDGLGLEELHLRSRTIHGKGQSGLKHNLGKHQEAEIQEEEVKAGANNEKPIKRPSPMLRSDGEIKTIRTNWAHPIDYKFYPPDDDSIKCHFCEDYRYGMFGCGVVEIEVIAYPNNVAYEETGSGHRAQGKEATRMCYLCALDRLTIMRCHKHEICALPGCEETHFNLEAAYEDLMASKAEIGSRWPEHPWCSMCLSPAFYMCNRVQHTDRLGNVVALSDEEKTGCGLRLCGSCAAVVQQHGTQREKIEEAIREIGSGLRADMGFLFPGSDLQKAYLT